jgi:HK97 family phage prohead protease
MMLKHQTPTSLCNLKFSSDDTTGEFEGYASVFDSVDQVQDTIAPGAFTKSLRGRLPAMFINHDHGAIPVGDWVDMKEDATGLFGVGRIDLNHKDGPSAYSAMKRGAMTGLSIGFTMNATDFDRKADGGRIIKNMSLREVSVVTFPCEDSARILGVKADDIGEFMDLRECETWLREEAGFSRLAAKALVSRILKMGQREAGASADESPGAAIKSLLQGIKL